MPAAGQGSGRGRRHPPLRPQRNRRGRCRCLPFRPPPVHRDRRGDRADAGASRDPARPPLLRPLPRGRGGTRGRGGSPRVSWFLAFVGFALLIILHEGGHFAAAKAVGMRVERFALFFPPYLARRTRGETEYAIGAIPLGGFVKITGMNPDEKLPDDVRDRAYHAQPVWKRVVVVAAGPFVNLVLALLLLFVFFWQVGPREVAVDQLQKGFPAAEVLKPGDQIVSVDGRTGTVRDLSQRIAQHRCAQQPPTPRCRASEPARLVVERDGRRIP